MAETVLTPVVEKLLQLLVKEANLIEGVHGQVNNLKDELEIIQCFLKDADSRSKRGETSSAVKLWMKQVRELADRIEDAIDEYLHRAAIRRRRRRGSARYLRETGFLIRSLKPRHDIAAEIRGINECLSMIKERGERYGLRLLKEDENVKSVNLDGNDPRLRSLFIEEDELVGIESTSQ